MIQWFIGFLMIALIYAGYTYLPNYWARHKTDAVKKTLPLDPRENAIALTFDDGPDENYTEAVLDLLEKHQIKATFFLVATKAEKFGYIVERMKKEGHDIAMHSYKHKSAWLSLPWETKKEFEKSLNIFKRFNLDVHFFRPPWGTFNAVSLKAALKQQLEVVLWSVEAYDWRKDNTPERISQVVLERIKANDILVLHDSGGAIGAPDHTIQALKNLIPSLKEQGFVFITLNEGMHPYEQC